MRSHAFAQGHFPACTACSPHFSHSMQPALALSARQIRHRPAKAYRGMRSSRPPPCLPRRKSNAGTMECEEWGLNHRRAAAVDVDGRAGDVGGGVGGEEARDVGEFLGAAETPERNVLGACCDIVREVNAG